MNHWLEFLQSQNAHIDDGEVVHFEQTNNTVKEPMISPLSHYGVLALSGADVDTFIQNQFCNDVRLTTLEQSQLSAYCSPKGRVLSLFRLVRQADRYLLLMPRERILPTQQRLKMFVLMSQVVIEDVSNEMAIMGCYGPGSDALLQQTLLQQAHLPTQTDQCVQIPPLTLIHVSQTGPMYLILGSQESIITAWSQLQDGANPTGPYSWRWHGIQAGLPEIYPATSEDFVPQMLNLHSLNAINFKKGCYPGQEVVARVHYLGKQKRRMYLAHAHTQTVPHAGENLHTKDDPQGQSVGKVVCAEPAPDGGADFLAVIQTKNAESDSIQLPDGSLITIKDLPYFVELEGKKS
ncbi:MAG: folate-binding protein [Gammaproteobacteria bacterium]|nr:folate-binding protein [Gammaproteobacteria bacterium]MDH5801020.1 folate-binding protein [Gammaproteobacteria bacterium]